jgi:hypothetical protein
MRAFKVKLPSGARYWTVVDEPPQRVADHQLSSFSHVHYSCCARPLPRSRLLPGGRPDLHVPHICSPQEKRPHRSLGQRSPQQQTEPAPTTLVAPHRVRRRDRLGGLVHEYELAA